MRHHSQRVPGKNYRPLAGKPLYQHIVETLLACPEIGQVVVDTDSPPMIAGLRANFPQVLVLERPEHLRADHIPMNEILAYDTSQVRSRSLPADPQHQPAAAQHDGFAGHPGLAGRYPAYDSLFSVTRLQTRLWDQLGRAINHNPAILLQTQDLPPVYEENSCLYIFTRQNLLGRRNRLGERPMMFAIEAAEAWDIDEELDFAITDFLMSNWKK